MARSKAGRRARRHEAALGPGEGVDGRETRLHRPEREGQSLGTGGKRHAARIAGEERIAVDAEGRADADPPRCLVDLHPGAARDARKRGTRASRRPVAPPSARSEPSASEAHEDGSHRAGANRRGPHPI